MERPQRNYILASRRADVTDLNREAQARRLAAGYLGKTNVSKDGQRFHRGDRVAFKENNKAMGVENGQSGTVKMVMPGLKTLTVALDNGKVRTFSLNAYSKLALAYSGTTHVAQGATTMNAFVLTDEKMQDRHLSYVQTSRAKEHTKIFTTRLEAGDALTTLARNMGRTRKKELALEQRRRAEAEVKREQSLQL